MIKGSKDQIGKTNFNRAVNYLIRNGESSVGLIGGEPTLHPRFFDLVDYAIDKGLQVQLFTNGIIQNKMARLLAAYDTQRLGILLNLNDKSFYRQKILASIQETLSILNDKIVLGYTVHTIPFSLAFHKEMILTYKLKKFIRLGLASPLADQSTQDFFSQVELEKLGGQIISNAQMLEKDDILIFFDCGFFMCMFTSEELGILTRYTLGFKSECRPCVDIDPDLQAHCCFPLTDILTKPLSDFSTLPELKQYFNKKLQAVKIFGNHGKCFDCKYLKRGQCEGWCVGRIGFQNQDLLTALEN
jgi:hypothetical protein